MSSNWVDFQSGCGICKASTDYNAVGGGVGNYGSSVGDKVMIPRVNGKIIKSGTSELAIELEKKGYKKLN